MTKDIPQLQKYVCHKEVRAAKIVDVTLVSDGAVITAWVPGASAGFTIDVPSAYVFKHFRGVEFTAILGGYYVLYADGYESFSPGPVFDEGYTLKESEEL